MSAEVRLCRVDEVPDGGTRGFTPAHDEGAVFVVRRGTTLRVYRDRCPHQGARMAWRTDAYLNHDATRIVCWAHGAQFDIDTGLCVIGPCIGQHLQAVSHRVDADSVIRLTKRID